MMQATYLGNMFKLFSIAFTPQTPTTANVVASGMMLDDMRAIWQALELPQEPMDEFASVLEAYRGRDLEEVLHELRTDWAHLYLGNPPRVTNTEGLWRFRAEGRDSVRMINRYTNEVADFMRTCGVKRVEGYNDCIDYLENECDFAAFLANEPAYLVEMGKNPIELLESFIAEHMLLWVPGFCEDVEREATTPYYQALAKLMGAFVKEFDYLKA